MRTVTRMRYMDNFRHKDKPAGIEMHMLETGIDAAMSAAAPSAFLVSLPWQQNSRDTRYPVLLQHKLASFPHQVKGEPVNYMCLKL